jgi:hypothetical protein
MKLRAPHMSCRNAEGVKELIRRAGVQHLPHRKELRPGRGIRRVMRPIRVPACPCSGPETCLLQPVAACGLRLGAKRLRLVPFRHPLGE